MKEKYARIGPKQKRTKRIKRTKTPGQTDIIGLLSRRLLYSLRSKSGREVLKNECKVNPFVHRSVLHSIIQSNLTLHQIQPIHTMQRILNLHTHLYRCYQEEYFINQKKMNLSIATAGLSRNRRTSSPMYLLQSHRRRRRREWRKKRWARHQRRKNQRQRSINNTFNNNNNNNNNNNTTHKINTADTEKILSSTFLNDGKIYPMLVAQIANDESDAYCTFEFLNKIAETPPIKHVLLPGEKYRRLRQKEKIKFNKVLPI